MNNLKELLTGEYDRNVLLITVDNDVKREIVGLMASGDLTKDEGLRMLKADYLVFSFIGMMQLDSRGENSHIYYGTEISKWFEEIKARNNINLKFK